MKAGSEIDFRRQCHTNHDEKISSADCASTPRTTTSTASDGFGPRRFAIVQKVLEAYGRLLVIEELSQGGLIAMF